MAAVRVMALPRKRWKDAILETVEPHLQEMVRTHMKNELWRRKWVRNGQS